MWSDAGTNGLFEAEDTVEGRDEKPTLKTCDIFDDRRHSCSRVEKRDRWVDFQPGQTSILGRPEAPLTVGLQSPNRVVQQKAGRFVHGTPQVPVPIDQQKPTEACSHGHDSIVQQHRTIGL